MIDLDVHLEQLAQDMESFSLARVGRLAALTVRMTDMTSWVSVRLANTSRHPGEILTAAQHALESLAPTEYGIDAARRALALSCQCPDATLPVYNEPRLALEIAWLTGRTLHEGLADAHAALEANPNSWRSETAPKDPRRAFANAWQHWEKEHDSSLADGCVAVELGSLFPDRFCWTPLALSVTRCPMIIDAAPTHPRAVAFVPADLVEALTFQYAESPTETCLRSVRVLGPVTDAESRDRELLTTVARLHFSDVRTSLVLDAARTVTAPVPAYA